MNDIDYADPLMMYYGLTVYRSPRPIRRKPPIQIQRLDRIQPRQEVYIYVLLDAAEDEVRYVGSTNNIFSRACEHLDDVCPFNHRLSAWISLLIERGEPPVMRVIDACDQLKRDDLEDFWIEHYAKTYELFNKGTNKVLKKVLAK